MKTIEIPLGRSGLVAVIDDLVMMDYRSDLVRQYTWGKHSSGRTMYARVGSHGEGTRPFMHTLLTGWPVVDHEDRNGLNNRRSNLRPATKSQNGANRDSVRGSSSQYLGVSWRKASGKWVAQITVGGRKRYLGLFASEIDAAIAYDVAARIHHDEFANPNFPDLGAS